MRSGVTAEVGWTDAGLISVATVRPRLRPIDDSEDDKQEDGAEDSCE